MTIRCTISLIQYFISTLYLRNELLEFLSFICNLGGSSDWFGDCACADSPDLTPTFRSLFIRWSRELFGELSADALPVEVEDLVDGARRRPQALLELGLGATALHVTRLLGGGGDWFNGTHDKLLLKK